MSSRCALSDGAATALSSRKHISKNSQEEPKLLIWFQMGSPPRWISSWYRGERIFGYQRRNIPKNPAVFLPLLEKTTKYWNGSMGTDSGYLKHQQKLPCNLGTWLSILSAKSLCRRLRKALGWNTWWIHIRQIAVYKSNKVLVEFPGRQKVVSMRCMLISLNGEPNRRWLLLGPRQSVLLRITQRYICGCKLDHVNISPDEARFLFSRLSDFHEKNWI